MAITFFYSPRSSATRALWALEELGVPFEKVRVDLTKGEQKKPAFLAVNPNGKVPAMLDGDARLFESLAILLHLGDRYGEAKGLWPAPGTAERAEAFTWSVWGTVTLLDVALHAGAPDTKTRWETCLEILDARLEGSAHLLGDAFSLADVAVTSNVAFGVMAAGLPVEPYPNVSAWLDRCKARPAFERAMNG
jgi:glutathione S-transferase